MNYDPVPAGWYADPDKEGQKRYWDGQGWSEHRVTFPAPAAVPAPPARTPEEAAKRRNRITWWTIGVSALLLVVVTTIGAVWPEKAEPIDPARQAACEQLASRKAVQDGYLPGGPRWHGQVLDCLTN